MSAKLQNVEVKTVSKKIHRDILESLELFLCLKNFFKHLLQNSMGQRPGLYHLNIMQTPSSLCTSDEQLYQYNWQHTNINSNYNHTNSC